MVASWNEWSDGLSPSRVSAPLPSLPVTRGAAALPTLWQEFGDTKHRVIDLTLTAVSRYRDCFAGPTEDAAFTTTGIVAGVVVKNSARPAPPVAAATVPAFAWSEIRGPGTLTRARGGGRLRVELAHPWFTTGEGEAVGVVLWPGSEDTIPDQLRDMVSRLNRDPIQPTAAPPVLAAESMFTGFGEPVGARLPDSAAVVRVLPFPVFSHGERWYADIALPGAAAASYAPFARLALVRFQRQSLVGTAPASDLRVSAAVRTDMVPLLPDRRLEVRQDSAGLHITLSGVTRQGPRTNRVQATLERADALGAELTALSISPPAVSHWTKVPGAVAEGTTNQPLSPITLPADAGTLRLVVRKVEQLTGQASGVGVGAAQELTERTVYVDVVDLPVG